MAIHHGDCLEVLRGMADASVDSIVTDPPYGLSFMGKRWDYDVPSEEIWRECLRVLKPGGHLLAFAGPRTQHRMAVRIEDAGFEIRDMIAWVYGSGFPKSLNLAKAMDKSEGLLGHEGKNFRNVSADTTALTPSIKPSEYVAPEPKGDAAKQWYGWGTALKPALEPITMARKPLTGTVAANVLEHGTGAINVDECRVGDNAGWSYPNGRGGSGWHGRESLSANLSEPMAATQGRWPANLIHDGSDEVVALFPVTAAGNRPATRNKGFWADKPPQGLEQERLEGGSAARFFYCAKASKADRDEGLDMSPDQFMAASNQAQAQLKRGIMHEAKSGVNTVKVRKNHHPTVKPTDLMRYLCRLVTPPGGTVLDPFMGSGSTGKAAVLEGFNFIGIEREAEYVEIAKARIAAAAQEAEEEARAQSGQLLLAV